MARNNSHTAAASLLLLLSSLLSAQSGPPQHPARPKMVGPAKWEPSPQEISAAYWTLEPGWNTDVEVRNNLKFRELTITPVLRASSGQEVSLAPVTVPAQHIVSLDLRKLAQSDPRILNGAGSFGSVTFRFNGLDPANLFAATIVRREGQPIDFHFDADVGSNYSSGGIEGIWWLPAASSTDYLILSNPLKRTVTGTLAVPSASAPNRQIRLSIGPGETKRIDLREILGPAGVGAVGGLSLSLPGKELISATQIVFDEVTGLAAIMKLFDREPEDQPKNRVLVAPMMALSQPDPTLALPNGTTLIPRLFLRNAGLGDAQVSLTVDWRNESKSGKSAFPLLTLLPGEVRVINLADTQSSAKTPADATWGTVKIACTGRRADLVAVALSYDEDNRYGLQTPFSEGLSHLWAGGMWHVDATHNTLITTGNEGSEATKAEVTLFYNGGKSTYRKEEMLSPGQQLWLDVGQLVRNQIPDSDGHILPPDVMAGSCELSDLDHATIGHLHEGKLVIDKTYGHATYGCSTCCGYSSVVLGPNPFSGPLGYDSSDFIHATQQCGGYVDDVTDTGYNWGSSNTAVATLPSSTLHTVAVGGATGRTYAQLESNHPEASGNCQTRTYNPQQPVTVQPTVTISGSTYLAMLNSGSTGGGNTTTLTASGNPSGGTYSWSAVSGQGNITISNASSQSATIQATAVGTYTVQVTYTVNNHPGTATTVGRVQQPGSLGVVSNDTFTYKLRPHGIRLLHTGKGYPVPSS